MLLITEEMVRRCVTLPMVINAVEKAFIGLDQGTSAIFDVVRGTGTSPSHYFAVKSGRDGSIPAIGVKAGSYNPENCLVGAAAHTSSVMLIRDDVGEPYAVVQGNYLNGMRTAAADALAVRVLAREDSEVLGLIGWGAQAVFEVRAVCQVRPIRKILACGRSPDSGRIFAEAVKAATGLEVELASVEATVRHADILVTVTPATAPLFEAGWVRPGTHISAMGADNIGKQELPIELMHGARLFVDHAPQAILIGEAQHAYRAGMVDLATLERQTLGALLHGRTQGRTSVAQITVFDSSGVSIQDIAAAHAAYAAVVCTDRPSEVPDKSAAVH